MTALPIDTGPSRTIIGAIDWFARTGAELLANPHDTALERAGEARDQIASLLHLFQLLHSDHDAWASTIHPQALTPADLDMLRRYAAAFQKWHDAASALLASIRALAALGYEFGSLKELKDAVGFCPYAGISVDDRLARQNAPEGSLIPLEKVRDGLRRRIHAPGG